MYAINRIELTGNLGCAPEVRIYESGIKAVHFAMATREEYTTRNGYKGVNTQWHLITVSGKLAELAAGLTHGMYINLIGKMQTQSYIDKTGQKRYIAKIVATEITVLERVI